MATIAAWHISDSGPSLLRPAKVDIEAQLEAWIDQQPDLVQFGLTVLGRQVRVDAGVVDLLALDPLGRWCVIEIKRDLLDRDALAQVQDYAACLHELTETELRSTLEPHLKARALSLDELLRTRDATDSLEPRNRQIVMFVVGTQKCPGLDRIVRYLAERHQIPIYTKLFTVFEPGTGTRVLIRDTSQGEIPQPPEGRWQVAAIEDIRAMAERGGRVAVFDTLRELADRHGLRPRPWKQCVMYTPPTDGRRCLFTVWASPQQGGLQVYVEPKAFAEFFPVAEDAAMAALSPGGYSVMDADSAKEFAVKLDGLLLPKGICA